MFSVPCETIITRLDVLLFGTSRPLESPSVFCPLPDKYFSFFLLSSAYFGLFWIIGYFTWSNVFHVSRVLVKQSMENNKWRFKKLMSSARSHRGSKNSSVMAKVGSHFYHLSFLGQEGVDLPPSSDKDSKRCPGVREAPIYVLGQLGFAPLEDDFKTLYLTRNDS